MRRHTPGFDETGSAGRNNVSLQRKLVQGVSVNDNACTNYEAPHAEASLQGNFLQYDLCDGGAVKDECIQFGMPQLTLALGRQSGGVLCDAGSRIALSCDCTCMAADYPQDDGGEWALCVVLPTSILCNEGQHCLLCMYSDRSCKSAGDFKFCGKYVDDLFHFEQDGRCLHGTQDQRSNFSLAISV